MKDHPTCSTCKHYTPPEKNSFDGPVRGATGHCQKIPHGADMTQWNERLKDVLKPEYEGFLAVVNDGSGYHAELAPKPEFYCAMHSKIHLK